MDLRVKSEDIDQGYLKDQTEKDGSVTWLKEKAELVKKVDYSTELIKKLEERIFFLKAQTDVAGERLSNFEAQTNKKISILKAEAALKDLQLKEFMNSTNQLFTQSEEKAERRHKALIEELFQKDKKISLLEQQVSSLQTGFSDASQGICAEQGNSTSIKTLDLMKLKRKRKLVETGSDHKSSQSSPSRPSSSSCSDSESECKKVKSVLQQKKSYSHINNTTTITATTTDSTTTTSTTTANTTTTATAPTVTTTTATTSLNGTSSSSCNTFSDKNIADKDSKTGITTSSSQEEFTCVEDDRGRKRLLCTVPECGKMFKNINGIKYHMKNSHRDSHEPRKSAKSAKTSTKTSDPVKLKGKRKLMETGSGHKSSPSSPSSPSSSSSSSSSESESECKKVKSVLQQEKSSRHINNTTTITATATDSTTTSATTTTATTTTATTSGNGTSSSSCNTFSNKNIADNS